MKEWELHKNVLLKEYNYYSILLIKEPENGFTIAYKLVKSHFSLQDYRTKVAELIATHYAEGPQYNSEYFHKEYHFTPEVDYTTYIEVKNTTKEDPTVKNYLDNVAETKVSNHMTELLLNNFNTIAIRFPGSSKSYTYKVPKAMEFDKDSREYVIVDGHSGLQVVEVVDIHEVPKIDMDADYKYTWIVQKVDFTLYNEHKEKDEKANQLLAELSRRELQTRVKNEFLDELSNEERLKLSNELGIELDK